MNHPSITEILSHVPGYVWAILAFILLMGLLQVRDQWMSRSRLRLLPMIWLVYGIWGVVSSFGYSATAVLPWVFGLVLSQKLVSASGWPGGSHYDRARDQFLVAGSYLPLVLMMGIFLAKFGVGISAALRPELLAEPAFAATFSALFGAIGGIFLARSRNILRAAESPFEGPLEAA
jgi:hypothetical protein